MTILAGNSADKITLLLNGKWSRRRVIAFGCWMVTFHVRWFMPRATHKLANPSFTSIIYSLVSFHIPGHRNPYSEALEARPCPL